MTARYQADVLVKRDEIVAAPAPRACEDQHFDMPTGLYAAMAALLFGFLGVLAVGLADPALAVPMGVNFAFLTAFFAIPAIFVRTAKDGRKAMRWSEFMSRGIETATGHASGREAVILTLMLPLFIFGWAIAIVTIWASV